MAGSLTGQVLNQRDGQPIAGATCTLDGSQNTTSGSDGKFAFDNLTAYNYELTVSYTGFENGIYGPLVVIDGIATDITVALQPKDIG